MNKSIKLALAMVLFGLLAAANAQVVSSSSNNRKSRPSLSQRDLEKDLFEVTNHVKAKPGSRPHASYTVTTLDIPGADRTRLFGIDDRGDIAGGYQPAGQRQFGFVLSNGVFA